MAETGVEGVCASSVLMRRLRKVAGGISEQEGLRALSLALFASAFVSEGCKRRQLLSVLAVSGDSEEPTKAGTSGRSSTTSKV